MTPLYWHKKRTAADMSPTAEILMNMVVNHDKFSVMELLTYAEKHKVGSAATLHRAYSWLSENKFIKTYHQEGNQRTKFIQPSEKAKRYLEITK